MASGHRQGAAPAARAASVLALFALVAGLLLGIAVRPAQADAASDAQTMLALTNQTRAQAGLPPLVWDQAAAGIASWWSGKMANSGTLSHNPYLADQISSQDTANWSRLGENVGYGWSLQQLQDAFVASPGHYANIVGDYNQVGIGVVTDGSGRIWVTLDFVKAPIAYVAPPPAPAPAVRGAHWYLRNTLTTGVADADFWFGLTTDQRLSCDWNGDGIDTPGVYRNGVFFLSNQNTTASSGNTAIIPFGDPGDIGVCGDWTGSGYDSIGVYRNGRFYIRFTIGSGAADMSFPYGDPGDLPVVGDWDGDGKDSVGVYRNTFYYLTNALGGFGTSVFRYGDPGDQPVAGDWDGNGTDTIGIFRSGTLYLKNTNTTGVADYAFGYGDPGDQPVIGKWAPKSPDRLGVTR
jgi:uncharacterized protein YkwD